jgi:uncharacterized membrane protein YcaP (DUF421 family)
MIEDWFLSNSKTLLFIMFSTIGIYISIVILTRIFGKRSFSKMSSFDFACTVAIGSIIASTLLSKSVSLPEGIIGLFSIFVLQTATAYFRRLKTFRAIVDNDPLLLMDGEQILWGNLKKARVTEGDLKAKLREANVLQLSDVKAVVFETTGDIAVLHGSEMNVDVDAWILDGVKE